MHCSPARSTPRVLRPTLALSLLLGAAAASADPVLDQIEAAKRAYEDGNAAVAIQGLNFAAAQIEQQQTAKQLQLFPAPLPGWVADDASADAAGLAAMLTGKVLSRAYREPQSGAGVKITISANSPFLGVMTSLMQMPLLMQADPGTTLYSFEGHQGMLKQNAGGVDLTLMLGTNLVLQLQGTGGATQANLEAFLHAMDLPAVQKALTP